MIKQENVIYIELECDTEDCENKASFYIKKKSELKKFSREKGFQRVGKSIYCRKCFTK